jgi:hypothetical protein
MWVFLQYLLGFRRLGYDVLYLDALEPDSYVDEKAQRCPLEESWSVRYLRKVMSEFDLGNNYSLLCDGGTSCIGLSRREVVDRVRQSTCLINVMGFLRDAEILAAARRRVFLDIDPGFGQMWRELGLADILADHDAYVTVGANVGQSVCTVPTCGLNWITTVPPIVLEYWPPSAPRDDGNFTSIVTWRSIFGPIEYRGTTYGLRVHEFRKFIELPSRTPQAFELALDIHSDETQDLLLLEQNGWSLVDPATVAGTPRDYQVFIQASKAEFGVAQNMYVKSRGGWISDRTVCYLASGRPALIQDTGIRELYPTRDGLLMFSNMDDAVDGIERICRNYDAHCQAARCLAEEHFDSDKVLARLLKRLDVE